MNSIKTNYQNINKKEIKKAVGNLMELTGAQTLDDINHLTKILQKFALENIRKLQTEAEFYNDKNVETISTDRIP